MSVPDLLRDRVVDLVSREFGVPEPVLLHHERGTGGWTVFARHLCLYLVRVEGNHGARETARAFGTTRENVRYACRRIEEHRDAALFEVVLSRVVAPLRAEKVLP